MTSEAPWVQHPIVVNTRNIFVWRAGVGLVSLEETAHAVSALKIFHGASPLDTEYARLVTGDQPGCHGNPSLFAALIAGVATDGVKKPVICGIDAAGRVVLHDGLHRSAAAYATGKPLPVSVNYRACEWLDFRYALCKLNGGRKLYQPIFHPDFAWPVWRCDTKKRVSAIDDAISEECGPDGAVHVTDIGCHSGTISLALARLGYDVTGIDRNHLAVDVARRASRMAGEVGCDHGMAKFMVSDALPVRVDVAICLSALNHAVVSGHGDEMLRMLTASAGALIVDRPNPGDPVGGSHPISTEDGFVSWITSIAPGKMTRIMDPSDGGGPYRAMYRWIRA